MKNSSIKFRSTLQVRLFFNCQYMKGSGLSTPMQWLKVRRVPAGQLSYSKRQNSRLATAVSLLEARQLPPITCSQGNIQSKMYPLSKVRGKKLPKRPSPPLKFHLMSLHFKDYYRIFQTLKILTVCS